MTSPLAQELGQQMIEAVLSGKTGIPAALQLLAQGASVHEVNKHGHSALFLASLRNHQEMVRELLDRGADPNLQNRSGETPLMGAMTNCYVAVAKMLIEAGADPSLTNLRGQTAADLALARHQDKNARLIGEWSRGAAERKAAAARETMDQKAVKDWIDAGMPVLNPVRLRPALTLRKGAPHA